MYEEDRASENASDAYQMAADYYLGAVSVPFILRGG